MATLHLFAPITSEEEYQKLIGSQGKYIPSFSESSLQLSGGAATSAVTGANFVFDNSAFGLSGSTGATLDLEYTPDVFRHTIPGTYQVNRQKQYFYVADSHSYAKRLFRHLPLHTVLGVDGLPNVGRMLDVEVIALPCNWIRVNGTSIVQLSPALEKSIERWKAKNKTNPKNEDYLGVTPYGFPCEVGRDYTDPVEIDFETRTIKGTPRTSILIVGSLEFANPHIGFTEYTGKYLVHDRGLDEYGTKETLEVALVELSSLLIRGTSNKKNWYVTISLDVLGIEQTVKTNPFDGSWNYTLPERVSSYIKENNLDLNTYKSQVKLLLHESATTGHITDPDVVRVQGLPREVLYDNKFIRTISTASGNATSLIPNQRLTGYVVKTGASFFKYEKGFYQDKNVTDPMLSALKKSSATSEEISKMFLGTYLGTNDQTADKLLMSTPGSVIDTIGIDVFVKSFERAYDAASTIDLTIQPNFFSTFSHAFSMSFGIYGLTAEDERITFSWSREPINLVRERYSLKWVKNAPDTVDQYSLRWSTGYEPREYQDKYRLRFSNERVRHTKCETLLRWHIELPDDDEDRLFYDFSWSKEQTLDETGVYRFRYTKEMTKTHRDTYQLKWRVPELDEVVVKPFYIKDGDRHHISYMVYGAPSVGQYILDDSLTFYFSNPSKYELVKFNRDADPYKGIFLKEFKDPSLENREGVPLNYTLIGNYTILDINVKNSLSLDVVAQDKQLNEFRSYWLPELSYFDDKYLNMANGMKSSELIPVFRDDHHLDVVELEVEFVNERECCFTQKSVGTRCSPY